MQNPDIHDLSAYLDGELNTGEREALESAIAESEDLQEELDRLRSLRQWAEGFPGRQPEPHVWARIEDTIATGVVGHSRAPGSSLARSNFTHRVLSFIPFYSREHGWSNGAKRTAIFGLAGIAVAGMGRSFYQEQRANLFEEKNRIRDEQTVRASTSATWGQDATDLRGQNGRRVSFRCPQNGRASPVWGTSVYTDDSSICSAAVHAGLIDIERGGQVQIEIRPGLSEYEGATRNGVRSYNFGQYDGSFAFVLDESAPRFNFDFAFGFNFETDPSIETISWDHDAESLRGHEGTMHTFHCPAGGRNYAVWGSGPYTDDSSICTAALHSGLIDHERGGTVAMIVGGRHPRFVGSEHHGVETRDFGSWEGSFVFMTENGNPIGETPVEALDWEDDARSMRGWSDFQTTLSCPVAGETGGVWGSEPYTDDSSICSAAVHAGLITTERGGLVTIEILPGMEKYEGSTRNGIRSRPYDKWFGSFRFVR